MAGMELRIMRLRTFSLFAVSVTVLWNAGQAQADPKISCQQLDSCSCRMVGGEHDGKIVSLWGINQEKGPRFTIAGSGKNKYYYNPCTGFTKEQECKDVLVCQLSVSLVGIQSYYNLGKPDKIIMKATSSQQVVFLYTGSVAVPGVPPIQRITMISLQCAESSTTPELGKFQIDQYNYYATLKTKCACPGACPRTPSGTPKSGISTGTILCIVCLVLVVVYVVGGILINKYGRHREGTEIIPNRDFWKDLPILVKDGATFSWKKIRRKEGQYEML